MLLFCRSRSTVSGVIQFCHVNVLMDLKQKLQQRDKSRNIRNSNQWHPFIALGNYWSQWLLLLLLLCILKCTSFKNPYYLLVLMSYKFWACFEPFSYRISIIGLINIWHSTSITNQQSIFYVQCQLLQWNACICTSAAVEKPLVRISTK